MVKRATDLECEILRLLITKGELYGLEMVRASLDVIKRGSIYVYLSRMEDRRWVTSTADEDAGLPGLPRRRYKVTGEGQVIYRATMDANAVFDAASAAGVIA